jgi:hypothetical protein
MDSKRIRMRIEHKPHTFENVGQIQILQYHPQVRGSINLLGKPEDLVSPVVFNSKYKRIWILQWDSRTLSNLSDLTPTGFESNSQQIEKLLQNLNELCGSPDSIIWIQDSVNNIKIFGELQFIKARPSRSKLPKQYSITSVQCFETNTCRIIFM